MTASISFADWKHEQESRKQSVELERKTLGVFRTPLRAFTSIWFQMNRLLASQFHHVNGHKNAFIAIRAFQKTLFQISPLDKNKVAHNAMDKSNTCQSMEVI